MEEIGVFLQAPTSSPVTVLAANNYLVGTWTITNAQGTTIYSAPFNTGTPSVQTLSPGQQIGALLTRQPDQFPTVGQYQVSATIQFPNATAPVSIGPLILQVH